MIQAGQVAVVGMLHRRRRRLLPTGRWSDPATWGGPVPAPGENVTIPAGQEVILDVDTAALGLLTVAGTLRADPGVASMTLTAQGILVLSGGKLLAGAPQSPRSGFHIVVNGARPSGAIVGPSHMAGNVSSGNPNDAWMGYAGLSRGILNMGEIRIHAEKRATLRTKLNDHAAVATKSFTVADSLDWPSGSNVYVAPTDYYTNQTTEVVTLSQTASGAALQTNQALQAARWGKLQYLTDTGISLTPGTFSTKKAAATMSEVLDQRAKVALLDRTCTITAPDDSEWQTKRFGVHIMTMGLDSAFVLDGVQIRRCGQGGLLGRYPIHWHMLSYDQVTGETLGNAVSADHRLEDCAIWESANRGVTIHGTRGVNVINNVSHDVKGHNLFLEDGSEEDNIIEGNWFSGARSPNAATGDAVTVTVGNPGIFNRTNHGFTGNTAVKLNGSMPGGFSAGSSTAPTIYWVVNPTANTFQLAATPGGVGIQATSAGSNVTALRWWAIKLHDVTSISEAGASGAWITNANNQIRNNSAFDNVARNWWQALQYPRKFRSASGASFFTTGTPGVVNWTAHGLTAGQTLIYTTTGSPAAPLTQHQVVYVSATGLATNTFQISATHGGASINIASLGSGTHRLMGSACFGASSNVPIIPFYTPPKTDESGNPLYDNNEGHSAGLTGNVLNFAATNEQGTIADGSAPSTTLDVNGPRFKSPATAAGTDVLGRFSRFYLWKNQGGGYQNRVVNPWYDNWVQADNLGTDFFGATQEGFGNKLSAVVIAQSLNITTAPPGTANVRNAFASYHSALDFVAVTGFNYSSTTPVVASGFPYNTYGLLFSQSLLQTWDFYTNPVEMGFGRHGNWKLVNSVATYRTPPPNVINDDWDTWTGNQSVDTSSVVRRWTLAGALHDAQGIAGTPGRYLSFNIPFCTYGVTHDVLSPAHMMMISTATPYYGVKPRADDTTGYVGSGDYLPAMNIRRLTTALAEVAGADWDIEVAPSNAEMTAQYPGKSTFFRGSRHFACPRGGYVSLSLPDLGVQSTCVRHVIYNCSRKAGVDGQATDDVFYLALDWSGAQVPRVFGSVGGITGTFPTFTYDSSFIASGRAVEFSEASSLAQLQSGAVCRYWRDTTNNRLVIKVGAVGTGFFDPVTNPYDTDDRAWDLVVQRP